MSKHIKKVLFSVFLAFFTLVNLSVPLAQAQSDWYSPDFFGNDGFYMKVNDPSNPTEIFGERYTAAQVHWIIWSVPMWFMNQIFPGKVLSYCIMSLHLPDGELPTAQNLATCAEGILGEIIPPWLRAIIGSSEIPAAPYEDALASRVPEGSYEVSPFTHELPQHAPQKQWYMAFGENPVSGVNYVRERLIRFNLIPEVQAQQAGFGFSAIDPVISLWRFSRNVSYFLMVLVVIALSFMIMFRVKLPPQTVITIQSALPSIAIALLLITFSYAIAGFMVDLMYVVLGLVAGIISSSPISGATWPELFSEFTNPTGVFDHLSLYGQLFGSVFLNATLQSGAIVGFLGVLSGPIINLIVTLYLLLVMIKVAFMLIKNYVMILLTVITGPFEILIGTLTGGGFGQWLKRLISYLAVYPITAFVLFIAFMFMHSSYQGWGTEYMSVVMWIICFVMPVSGACVSAIAEGRFPFGLEGGEPALSMDNPWVPPFTVGTGSLQLLWLFASLITLSMLPKATQIAQAFIMGGRFDMKSAMGELVGGLGIAATPLTYPVSRTAGAAMDQTAKEMGMRISTQVGKAAGVLGKKLSGRP